jgi:histidinol dehydrogenase
MMKLLPATQFNLERKLDYGTEAQNLAVREIIEQVRAGGDRALVELTARFDKVELQQLRVTEAEIASAYELVDGKFLSALREAAANIRRFHEKQTRTSWMDVQPDGTMLGQLLLPLSRVGIYVPGGKAAYPSSVLMNAIPAKVAGVGQVVMVTPPATAGDAGIDPNILVAAAEAGVDEIYRVGGAQAIAALAYGTESIAAVDKIVGPGNIYVALAKRYVYGVVDIDMIAGPTEIVVLADETADPEYIAADLLSQAEHDELASSILIATDARLADAVQVELVRQLERLPKRDIAGKSLADHGVILLVDSIEQGVHVLNRLAPEHAEIMVAEPLKYLGLIQNAGSIFLGPYSSEPVGDYFAGPNHVLPTNGTARFSSPLNTDDFIKKSSVIYYSKEALLEHGENIITLAEQERLHGHAQAIRVRLEKEGGSR